MPDRLKSTGKRDPLAYGRGHYRTGEEFIASAPDAKVLVATGLATRIEDDEVEAEAPPAEAPPVIEPYVVPDAPAQPRKRGRPKGSYSRRDLRAEK